MSAPVNMPQTNLSSPFFKGRGRSPYLRIVVTSSKSNHSTHASEISVHKYLCNSPQRAIALNARKLANARHNWGKLLDPFGRIDFAHEYVPERVDADRVCKVKLTSEATISAEVPERLSA